MGRAKAPNSRSAKAILITRFKLFLRTLLLAAKRTIVRRFPTAIKKETKAKTVHQVIPSGLERAFEDKPIFTSMLTFAEDVLFIGAISRKRLSSFKTESTTLHRKAF